MEKMSPPPNYFGAPYPNTQLQNGMNQFNKNQYGAPTFPNNETMFPLQNNNLEQGVTGFTDSTYEDLNQSIKNADSLFEILRSKISKNIGKTVRVYCSFTDSSKWHDMMFEGTLVAAADDYLLVKSNTENKIDLISRIYVNFISFLEE